MRVEKKQVRYLIFAFALLRLDGVGGNLLIVALKGGQVLTSFGELAFLHTLADVPVDERALGVKKVELVIQSAPC